MGKHYKTKALNKNKKYNSKQNKPRKISIMFVIRIFFIITMIISLIYMIKWWRDNKANEELNSNLSQYISIDSNDMQKVSINFEKLKQENEYFFAWLIVNGTNINYPVVHYKNNDYYLNHSFDNSKNSAGCPFADYKATCDGTDKNLVIYGHNRRDRQYVCYTKRYIKRRLVF